ncbi:MAG: lipid-A-disaccharide synthase [Candidatus Omnitrophota bacterium]
MKPKKKIFIVAGEPSGDFHASNLVRAIRERPPEIEFFGLGGKLMKEAGVETYFDIAELALMGVIEILLKIGTVQRIYRGILKKIDITRPDMVILVDYPGFNLKMAQALAKRGIPIVYFISPQLWAWGKWRISIIKRCVKKVVVFFKFEEALYRQHGIPVEFIGHPLIDAVHPSVEKSEMARRFSLNKKKTVAVLPGSRTNEIRHLLPTILDACSIIMSEFPEVQFLISKAGNLDRSIYDPILKQYDLDMRIVEGMVYDVMNAADFAIAVSGTVTLECAIIGTPMVIMYRANQFSWMIFRLVSNIRTVGLANIVAGRMIVPELIQSDATPEKIAATTLDYLRGDEKMAAAARDLAGIKGLLGAPGAYARAAESVLGELEKCHCG